MEFENILFEQKTDETKDIQETMIEADRINQEEIRRVKVPFHRMNPLKQSWESIVQILTEKMSLLIRMNLRTRQVELKNSQACQDNLNLNWGAEFLKAFMLGFSLNDCISMLWLDDIYLETFEIKDVKMLHGQHLSWAIARIAGEKGKTRNSIENTTNTRLVVADSKIHLMGSYGNIRLARNLVSNLILGSPANKVYQQMRFMAKKKQDI